MFFYFYQFCLVIFLLQGVGTYLLLIVSGWLWRKQERRLGALKEELGRAQRGKVRAGAGSTFEGLLSRLPKLRPLNCANCGGNVVLRETETFCPSCHTRGDPPEDYGETAALRRETAGALRSALRHWRVANVLTHPAMRWTFALLALAEPLVLFPTVLIGAAEIPDTWVDRALGALGETASFVLMGHAFLGFVVWMIVLGMLSSLCKGLRAGLPAVPVSERGIRGVETANCQACGGGIEYGAGAFACLCSYCHVENLRVQFVRRERAQAEERKAETKSVLFGAMEIIEDFNGTLLFTTGILVVACVLLAAFQAVWNNA